MSRAQHLGELELVVLLVMARIDGPTHGMAVYDEIITTTGREISAPTVYITLARLARKQFVRALGPVSSDEGGRARKQYSLTKEGREACGRSARMLSALLSPRPSGSTR